MPMMTSLCHSALMPVGRQESHVVAKQLCIANYRGAGFTANHKLLVVKNFFPEMDRLPMRTL